MVHLVLAILLPRSDQAELSGRVFCAEIADLARRVAARIQEEIRAAAGPRNLQRELLVLLFVEERVRSGVASECVAVEAIGSLRGVVDDVEEGPVVGCPGDGADLEKFLGRERSRAQVFHEQRVLPEARDVGRVGEKVPVVADVEVADREELLAAGELVRVEHHFFRRVESSLPPAMDRILLPLLGPRVIEECPFPVRDGEIGFLDPSEHLGIELLLERLGRLHQGVGVRVLGVEVRANLRVVLPAKPEVVVLPLLSVNDVHFRQPPCGRRTRRSLPREQIDPGGESEPACHGDTSWLRKSPIITGGSAP